MAGVAVLAMTAGVVPAVVSAPSAGAVVSSGPVVPAPHRPPAPAPNPPFAPVRSSDFGHPVKGSVAPPAAQVVSRPGPPASQVAVPHLPPGSADGYSLGASVDRGAAHAGPGPVAAPPSGPGRVPGVSAPETTSAVRLASATPNAVTVPSVPLSFSPSVGPVSAELSWQPPSSNGGAAIDSYVMNVFEYVASAGQYEYVKSIESCGACTSAQVVGLVPDQYWSFTIYAHNSAGYSPPAASAGSMNNAANDTYVGESAGGGRVVRAGGTLTVSWSAPLAGGLTGYEVIIHPAGSGNTVDTYNVPVSSLSVTSYGLNPGASYYASVDAQYGNEGYDEQTDNALAGAPPPDALQGAGQRSFFTYDTYGVSDQTTAKVNVASGDLFVSQRDLSLPGVAASYTVGQDYNSLALATAASSGGGSVLPSGWRLNTGTDVRLALGLGTVTYYDRTGAAWTFMQNGSVWLPPPGLDVTLAYNSTSASWTIVDHETNETLTFDAAGVLRSDMDRNGNPVGFSSDDPASAFDNQQGPAVRITGGAGMSPANSILVNPTHGYADAQGNVHYALTSLSQVPGDGSGDRTTTFAYNTNDQLASVTDAAGATTSYGYDGAGNLQEITSPDGHISYFFYDTSHRVVEAAQYDGSRYDYTTYNYTTIMGKPSTVVTDPDNATFTYTLDSFNRVINTQDAAGNTTATGWTPDSQVLSATNQMGGTTNNLYNANPGVNTAGSFMESLSQTSDPNKVINKATYPISPFSGCNPAASQYLPLSTTTPAAGTTNGCYDKYGGPTSSTDPAGNKASVTYSADGTPLTSTTPDNQAANVTTDFLETYGHQVYYSYPSNGVGPDALTVYDIWGNVAATANFASGNGTYYTVDAMGRTTQVSYTPGASNVVNYTYDPDGNLTRQVDNSGTTATSYDGTGKPSTRTAPGGVNDTYGYDPAGNLTTFTDPAGTTSYHYNNLNQADQVTEPSGRIDIVGYNPMGQQSDLWTNTGTGVTYNGYIVNPPAAFATHRHATYDTAGQITVLTNTLASSDSNVFSQVSYGYTTGGNCTGQPSGTITNQIQFTYDNVRKLENAYCYDGAGRLVASVVNNVFYGYAYDADGNPTSGALGTNTYNTADENTNSGYIYDADGNLTSNGNLTATYNSADQTTQNSTPYELGATAYSYTGTGQANRATLTSPSGTTTFANSLQGIESQNAPGATTTFTYLPDGTAIDETVNGATYYYLTDNQGSVIGLADTNGTPHANYTYTPYGAQTATAENGPLPPNPYGWDGGYTDNTTGVALIHFGARYYNPNTGQFTQLDPSGQNTGYTYCADDPINNVDATGLNPSSIEIAGYTATYQGGGVYEIAVPGNYDANKYNVASQVYSALTNGGATGCSTTYPGNTYQGPGQLGSGFYGFRTGSEDGQTPTIDINVADSNPSYEPQTRIHFTTSF